MMNGLDELIKVGDKINSRLTKIRKSIGAPLGNFTVIPKNIKIKKITGEMLAQGGKRNPIMIGGEFYLAYIKDNSNRDYKGDKSDYDIKVRENPSGCFMKGNRLHFYYCEKIRERETTGTDKRYVCTSYFSNVQPIDLFDESGVEARLALCKYCIGDLIINSGVAVPYCANIIAAYGNAQTLMHCVKLLYNQHDDAKRKTEEFINRTLRKAEV